MPVPAWRRDRTDTNNDDANCIFEINSAEAASAPFVIDGQASGRGAMATGLLFLIKTEVSNEHRSGGERAARYALDLLMTDGRIVRASELPACSCIYCRFSRTKAISV